jgi:BirA family transcriptional regulator, biotin operon repressor / biotin---[acetyl-CoA-carboxylase] ligase
MAEWPKGVALRQYESLDSTNEEARRLANAGARGPLWIAARQQTNGKGRRGRIWVSDAGNLFATLLTQGAARRTGELAFVSALAVGDTLAAFAPQSLVSLKWPNDVLLDGRKAAGILIENFGAAIAIGVGINLASNPAGTEFPATSVKENTGTAPEPDAALTVLAGAMAAWYERWRVEGFAPIREAWLSRAAGLGRSIRARLETSEVEGVFDTMDQDGALLIRMQGGSIRRIEAGDVFLR